MIAEPQARIGPIMMCLVSGQRTCNALHMSHVYFNCPILLRGRYYVNHHFAYKDIEIQRSIIIGQRFQVNMVHLGCELKNLYSRVHFVSISQPN